MSDFFRRTGILPGTVYVLASNASAADLRQARILKARYGELIQICDGVDDVVELDAAREAVLALGGGSIILSDGTFNAKLWDFRNDSDVDISGQGANTVLLMPVMSQADADAGLNTNIRIVDSYRVSVRNLKLDNNGINQVNQAIPGRYYYIGLHIEGAWECIVEDIWTKDCIGGGIYIDSNGPAAWAEHITLNNIHGFENGINSTSAQQRHTLHIEEGSFITVNNLIDDASCGAIFLSNVTNCSFNNIQSHTATMRGMLVNPASDCQFNNITITNGREGIYIGGNCSRLLFNNINIQGTTGDYHSLLFTDGIMTNLIFNNVTIQGAVRSIWAGIPDPATLIECIFNNVVVKDISGANGWFFNVTMTDCIFGNCVADHCNGAGFAFEGGAGTNNALIGCTARDNNGRGFTLAGGSGWRVIGCQSYNTAADYIQTYGLYLGPITDSIISGNNFKGNTIGWADLTAYTPATNVLYERHSDIFMDVLAVSATHVRSNEDLSVATPITFTIDAQPDVPRTLSGHFDTHAQITAYSITIVGVDARGNIVTETFTEAASPWDFETVNAFATITSIIMTARTGTGVGDTMDIGITDVLGLSNKIYETADVYKIKKNTADALVAVAQVNTTYNTYDMAVIILGAGDDFTIWYKTNLNIVS